MDYISFFEGLVLGLIALDMERFLRLLKVALCCITAGYIMLITHPHIYIWHHEDYNKWANFNRFLFHSEYGWQSVLLIAVVYSFFYVVLYKISDDLLANVISKRLIRFTQSVTSIQLATGIEHLIKIMVRWLWRASLISYEKK